jgi:hypothetical protein
VSAVDDMQADAIALADDTARAVAQIYARYLEAELAKDAAVVAIAAAVNRANAVGVALGDAGIARQIEELSGRATPTLGLLAVDESERLLTAATTVLDDLSGATTAAKPASASESASGANVAVLSKDHARNRLERLSRSEPLEQVVKSASQAVQNQPLAEGWVRHMEPGACELCQWIWRNGKVWPKQHPFQIMHNGDACTPQVVLRTDIESTGYTRKLARNAR